MLAKLLVRLIAPICILLTQPLFAAATDDPLKIGLIVPLTGGQASTGKQLDNAVKLYISENGDMVAGRKIEVIVKDDGAVPDNTKRIAHGRGPRTWRVVRPQAAIGARHSAARGRRAFQNSMQRAGP